MYVPSGPLFAEPAACSPQGDEMRRLRDGVLLT
jgi:hypothetical protein